MGFSTKVQLINRKASEHCYINFPSAIAQAMEFSKGETVEWIIEDKALLALRRLEAPPPVLKKLHWYPPPVRATLGAVRYRLRPAACRRTRANARAELPVCLGRHTVTGLLTTSGSQFQDWSAPYRLFSRDRVPVPQIFSAVRRGIADHNASINLHERRLCRRLLKRKGRCPAPP